LDKRYGSSRADLGEMKREESPSDPQDDLLLTVHFLSKHLINIYTKYFSISQHKTVHCCGSAGNDSSAFGFAVMQSSLDSKMQNL
jgi:hypothetical protein